MTQSGLTSNIVDIIYGRIVNKKILIVEDEEDILELLSEIFSDLGDYKILCARDGEEALRIAQKDNPDVILLDIFLPKMNGYDVCKSVKSDPTTLHAKVLMISGVVHNSIWREAQEAGADAFIAKPFDSIALVEKVEELLRSN